MQTNKEMKNLLHKSTYKKLKEIKINNKSLSDLLFPKFICVQDLVYIKSNAFLEEEANLIDLTTACFQSKTEYEIDKTETLINSYIDDSELYASDVVPFALIIARVWANMLKLLTQDDKICFIISCSDKLVTLRFHKLRSGEEWLNQDLEGYNQPICRLII